MANSLRNSDGSFSYKAIRERIESKKGTQNRQVEQDSATFQNESNAAGPSPSTAPNMQNDRVSMAEFKRRGEALTTPEQRQPTFQEDPIAQSIGPAAFALGRGATNVGQNLLATSNVVAEGLGMAPEGSSDARAARLQAEEVGDERAAEALFPDSGLLRGLVREGTELAPALGAAAASGGASSIPGLGNLALTATATGERTPGEDLTDLGMEAGATFGGGMLGRAVLPAARGIGAAGQAAEKAFRNNRLLAAGLAAGGVSGLESFQQAQSVGAGIGLGALGVGAAAALGRANSPLVKDLLSTIGALSGKKLKKILDEHEGE